LSLSLTGCINSDSSKLNSDDNISAIDNVEDSTADQTFINTNGNTIGTRILPPKGYYRKESGPGSFIFFTRNLPLKPDGTSVFLYDGKEKGNQSVHVAVIDMEIGDRDLQQCADAVIRLTAEYLFANNKHDEIGFHLTNGFYLPYNKWKEGYRLVVNGNNTYLQKSAERDQSYEAFRNYLDVVFAYAGTLSLENETELTDNLNSIKVGDIFIEGGSPGHAVMVIDIATDDIGDLAFLLAQSYMPAQDIHIIKNPLHEQDPWYYVDEVDFPFSTPQWTFDEYCLKTQNK